ncbi:MAG: DsrE family protein, partial [Candidatus Nanohaloarchaea archaeon]
MEMKTVFHLNSSEGSKQSELLGNLKNFRADSRTEIDDIRVVLNADAVRMARENSEAAGYIRDYLGEGIKFLVCSNSLENRDMREEELVEGVETVESG